MPGNGERIGFFLIQDGFDTYGDLPDNLSFLAPGTGQAGHGRQRAADPDERKPGRAHRRPGLPFLRQPQSERRRPGPVRRQAGRPELQIGFEDLPSATGDRDFQDVVIGIHVTGDGFLFT